MTFFWKKACFEIFGSKGAKISQQREEVFQVLQKTNVWKFPKTKIDETCSSYQFEIGGYRIFCKDLREELLSM